MLTFGYFPIIIVRINDIKGLIMKNKIFVSIITLIIAIMCCACTSETQQKSTTYTPPPADEYEYDITYKKEENDHSPVVYVTKYGKRYHKSSCHHSANAYMRLTVWQAIDRGYTACYFCCY